MSGGTGSAWSLSLVVRPKGQYWAHKLFKEEKGKEQSSSVEQKRA